MKLKLILHIATASLLGLGMMSGAEAGEGKAVSFIMIQDITAEPENPASVFVPTQDDFPNTNSAAQKSKLGVPQVADAGAGTQLDTEQACVTEVGGVLSAANPGVFPCPAENFYEQVTPLFQNFARGDAEIRATGGFVAQDGSQGIAGNTAPDANLIAGIQLNEDGDVARGASNASNTVRIIFPETIPGSEIPNEPSALVLDFNLDFCRETILGPTSIGTSITRAETTGNIVIQEVDGPVVFQADTDAVANPEIDALNDVTVAPSPGPKNIALDVFGNTGDCFPRPGPDGIVGNANDGEKLSVTVNTNPNDLPAAACLGEGTACFIAQLGVEYEITITAGTIADGQVEQDEEINVFKWYFGKQNPPFNGMQLPFPVASGVELNDQFGSITYDITALRGLMNPAIKNGETEETGNQHLSCYRLGLGLPPTFPPGNVPFATQNFGEDTARVGSARELCVSAMKNDEGSTTGPDYKCYSASSSQTQPSVFLDDQFDDFDGERATNGLSRFCTPVGKNAPDPAPEEELENPLTWRHLACYDIPRTRINPFIEVQLGDMLIEDAFATPGKKIPFSVEFERRFCEPAIKLVE